MLQLKEEFLREFSRLNLFSFLTNNFRSLGTFKHNVSVTKLVYQNIETGALLVYQTYPVVEHYFYLNTLNSFFRKKVVTDLSSYWPPVEGLNGTCGFKL